jgi:hypothetical protein
MAAEEGCVKDEGVYAITGPAGIRANASLLQGSRDSGAFSALAACIGVFFSCRTIFVLVSARWLGVGTFAGVFAGLSISAALLLASSLCAFGHNAYSSSWIVRVRPFQWIVLYLAFTGSSLVWSGTASRLGSAGYWIGLVSDVGIIFLLFRGCDAACAAHSLMKGFIAGTCVLATIAWIMPVETDLRLGDIEYFNTNQIGNLCALAVLMCALLVFRGGGQWRIPAWFLGITLFRSLSKSTLIAFIACQAYLLLCDGTMSRRRKWWLVVGSAAVAICFWGLLDAYFGVYTSAGNQAETLTGRTAIWAWALDAGLSHPWLGNGFDAMWKVAPPFGSELFEARHAENELLQQFFAYGVCGIVLWAGVYGSLYRRLRLLLLDSERFILTAFLVFAMVRGLAEAEPFDLVFPLWLITVIALLVKRELQLERHPSEIPARANISSVVPAH